MLHVSVRVVIRRFLRGFEMLLLLNLRVATNKPSTAFFIRCITENQYNALHCVELHSQTGSELIALFL